jgi:hypothetical protein
MLLMNAFWLCFALSAVRLFDIIHNIAYNFLNFPVFPVASILVSSNRIPKPTLNNFAIHNHSGMPFDTVIPLVRSANVKKSNALGVTILCTFILDLY